MDSENIKESKDKVSYREISPYFLKEMAYRLNKNKAKYSEFNWLENQDPEKIVDALERHVQELKHRLWREKRNVTLPSNLFNNGESQEESFKEHCAAAAINAMILFHTVT